MLPVKGDYRQIIKFYSSVRMYTTATPSGWNWCTNVHVIHNVSFRFCSHCPIAFLYSLFGSRIFFVTQIVIPSFSKITWLPFPRCSNPASLSFLTIILKFFIPSFYPEFHDCQPLIYNLYSEHLYTMGTLTADAGYLRYNVTRSVGVIHPPLYGVMYICTLNPPLGVVVVNICPLLR